MSEKGQKIVKKLSENCLKNWPKKLSKQLFEKLPEMLKEKTVRPQFSLEWDGPKQIF